MDTGSRRRRPSQSASAFIVNNQSCPPAIAYSARCDATVRHRATTGVGVSVLASWPTRSVWVFRAGALLVVKAGNYAVFAAAVAGCTESGNSFWAVRTDRQCSASSAYAGAPSSSVNSSAIAT